MFYLSSVSLVGVFFLSIFNSGSFFFCGSVLRWLAALPLFGRAGMTVGGYVVNDKFNGLRNLFLPWQGECSSQPPAIDGKLSNSIAAAT